MNAAKSIDAFVLQTAALLVSTNQTHRLIATEKQAEIVVIAITTP